MAGEVVGIITLAAGLVLVGGLILNHRTVAALRRRREELDVRMAGLEARAAHLAERPRRPSVASAATVHTAAHPGQRRASSLHAGARRVPPPLRVGR